MDDIRENETLSFGNILLRERKRKNISLTEVAENIGKYKEKNKNNKEKDDKEKKDKDDKEKFYVTPSYLSRLESGDKLNPSFKLVCLMTTRLSLDFKEVLKSFGYENLLSNIDKNVNKIEDIIRLYNIKAPIDENEEEGKETYLSYEEKESLIRIIKKVFLYGVCPAEAIVDYLGEIIGELEHYRYKRSGEMNRRFNISDITFEVRFDKKIKNLANSKGINEEQLFDMVQGLDSKLINKQGDFFIRNKDLNIIILCKRVENVINIKSVSDDFEEQ
jgi:hypothetical protein